MALPVSDAAETDDELVHGFDTTGYSQLPADHLSSDSSESSDGTSCHYGLGMLDTENFATTPNGDAISHFHHTSPCHNGSYLAPMNGMEIQAANQNEDVVTLIDAYRNGGRVTHIDDIGNRAEIPYHNDNFVTHVDGMDNQGTMCNINTLNGDGGHVVHMDGMEIHIYGQLAGLQLSSDTQRNVSNPDDEDNADDEDDVDESERQQAEDAAFQRAKEADDVRRVAPLPPERCQAIKNAMKNISLGGFRPEWADVVSEEEWVNRLRQKTVLKPVES